jgi:hypothetical protein
MIKKSIRSVAVLGFATLFTNLAFGQTTYTVDGTGGTSGAFTSITDALQVSVAGDTVNVLGMVDQVSGLVVGYNQANYFTGGSQETFPLQVPAGVTVQKFGIAPVFVWDSLGGSNAPNLVQISQSMSFQPTRIIGLSFLGGNNAIYSTASGSGNRVDLLVNECRFSRNRVGVFTQSQQGGLARTAVRNCLVSDQVPNSVGAQPALQDQQVGAKFWAIESEQSIPSETIGEILNLTTSGSFTAMDPQDPNSGQNGYRTLNLKTSRLVEVWALGTDMEVHEHPNAPTNYMKAPIPKVALDIIGGDWVGGDSTNGGWDVGLFAEARGDDFWNWAIGSDRLADYRSGFEITMSGTTLSNFQEDGIYCGAALSGRGNLSMGDGASVTDTGLGGMPSETRRSGLHAYHEEGYLGLEVQGCQFSGNRGNGLHFNADGEYACDDSEQRLAVPYGLYLDVNKSSMHHNGGHGIYMENQAPAQPSSFVGGTIFQDADGTFNIEEDGQGFGLPNGQGRINRCGISNNGMAGVRIEAEGEHGVFPDDPNSAPSGVAVRFSNSMIWNNPEGGVSATWLPTGGNHLAAKGFFLAPVSHCTLVANGDDTHNWNVEFDDQDKEASFQRAVYEWIEPGSLRLYRTDFWNSIFVRNPNNGNGPDLGPVAGVQGNSVVDDNVTMPTSDQIGIAGVRGNSFWGANGFGLAQMSDQAIIPFKGVGQFQVASTNYKQFLLSNSAFDEIIGGGVGYWNNIVPEQSNDIQGDARPGSRAGVEKGADEL